MVIHYEPARLRRNSDQPTAITGVLAATSASTYRTGDIPLGTPTSSARTRQGRWALYPNDAEIVVVHPGGALAGSPADVARELGHLGGNGRDLLGRAAVRAIGQFLTDPEFLTHPGPRDGARSPAARALAWSRPAVGYRLSGPANQPGHGDQQPSSWPGAPARPPQPLVALPSPTPPRAARPQPSPGTTTSRLTPHRPNLATGTRHADSWLGTLGPLEPNPQPASLLVPSLSEPGEGADPGGASTWAPYRSSVLATVERGAAARPEKGASRGRLP
jgi:hypothetical protein